MQPQQPNEDWQQPSPLTDENHAIQQDDLQQSQREYHQENFEARDEEQSLNESDEVLVRWQASEEIDHKRDSTWYMVFGFVTLVLIAVAIYLKAWSFAVLVPVMAIALFLYTRRPPLLVNYVLSRKGLHMNDKLYEYDMFKEFGVITDGGHHSVYLIPRKRFQMGVSVYFPEEVGEPIVDLLAARLPMRDMKLDWIDRLIRVLRI